MGEEATAAHYVWVRMQRLARASVFPLVFYRLLVAESLVTLAPGVKTSSRALATVFCTLWPQREDMLGHVVLWTILGCRCVLGLGEMLTLNEFSVYDMVQLMAPLPGVLIGMHYFRFKKHFWRYVSPEHRLKRAGAGLASDVCRADGLPVFNPLQNLAGAKCVFVSVDWLKYGEEALAVSDTTPGFTLEGPRYQPLAEASFNTPPIAEDEDTGDIVKAQRRALAAIHPPLASPSRRNSRSVFSFTPTAIETPIRVTKRTQKVRRSTSADGVMEMAAGAARRSGLPGRQRSLGRPSKHTRRPSMLDTAATLYKRLVYGKAPAKRKSSLLEREVTARSVLVLAFAAGTLSAVDAMSQYFVNPDRYANWQFHHVITGRWREAVLVSMLAPVQAVSYTLLACLGLWLLGFSVKDVVERLVLGWLSYFCLVAMHRWVDLVFAVAVTVVYRSHVEAALELIRRIGATVIDPSDYQQLLRNVKLSHRALRWPLVFVALNGLSYFAADVYSRFLNPDDDTTVFEDNPTFLTMVAFVARHTLSIVPLALMLWNVACLNEATHDKVIDRWTVMFLHWHHFDRLLKLRNEMAAEKARAAGRPAPLPVCLCFERYECVDWVDYIRNYRRGYLDILSRINKQLFYGWVLVAIATAVQANTYAAILHLKQVLSA